VQALLDFLAGAVTSPLLEFVGGLVLIVFSTSRFSPRRSNALLTVAWLLFAVGVFRVMPPSLSLPWQISWSVVVAVGVGVAMYRWLWVPSLPPITVSPGTLEATHSPLGSVKRPVFVTNNTDRVLFSVWVKISSETQGVTPQDIKFAIDDPADKPIELRAKGYVLSTDMLGVVGFDVDGRPAVAIRFYELKPNSRRRVTVWFEKPCVATCVVWSVADAATPLIESEEQMTVVFSVPEPFRAVGTVLPSVRRATERSFSQ
jgi:hypothetical protein